MSRSPLFAALRRLVARARRSPPLREGLDRRSFLISAGAAAAAATLPAAGTGCGLAGGDRVVVVGAGIAGLHCAYRLSRAGVAAQVYEANDRVGGRMATGRGLFLDDQVCEIGGELIDSNHATMWLLAEELGQTLDDRFAGEPAGFRREIYSLDGAEVSEETLVEQLGSVRAAFVSAYDAAEETDDGFDALNRMTLQAWLDANVPIATYRELHLALAIAYRGEYGLETTEQSALNLIYLFGFDDDDHFAIFGESDERWHTAGGNDLYPTGLADRLDAGQLHLGHRLVKAERRGGAYIVTFDGPTGQVEAECDHLVLALPFSVLRTLDLDGLRLRRAKREAIDTIGYGTNVKIMGGFSSRVWNTAHNAGGAVTSDLPFQQTWDTSIGQAGPSGILTNFLGGAAGVAASAGTAAERFASLLPDLDGVFPGVADAFTGAAVRALWPTEPTALGSYTCYRPGDWDYWSTEGERDGNVHFCGEHCSADFQGWMEGAAETGALVAAEILDDLRIVADPVTQRIVAVKTVVPQPCYHGRPLALRELRGRRRALAAAAHRGA